MAVVTKEKPSMQILVLCVRQDATIFFNKVIQMFFVLHFKAIDVHTAHYDCNAGSMRFHQAGQLQRTCWDTDVEAMSKAVNVTLKGKKKLRKLA
jgi:hypothetical protein